MCVFVRLRTAHVYLVQGAKVLASQKVNTIPQTRLGHWPLTLQTTRHPPLGKDFGQSDTIWLLVE